MAKYLHEFDTVQSIADSIGIKRQTLYNRSKKTGVDISKKSFNDEEWECLVKNKKMTYDKEEVDKELTEIDILNQRISEQASFIEILKNEIQAKNVQIDQAQKLQLIAEKRLLESDKEYISHDKNNKKSFFKKIFSYFN